MNENGGDPGGSAREKSWERSWTTDEMRQNAHAWNLAGDSGLLKHLQELSQTVLAHTHTTEKALDSLVEEINTSACDINTTNNKFLCLANTQFVENRVYDDDEKETPQDVACSEKKSKEENEALMLQKVREALSMSIAVLDTMFEPVEIRASDSEGESEEDKKCSKTLLLEPHNPYMHRPLPHLIGSEAFMSDDCIGLGDSPSDSEERPLKQGVDYDMEVSSESDVDFTPVVVGKRNRDLSSSLSSMSDHISQPESFGKHMKKSKPSDLTNEDEKEPISIVNEPIQNNDFATQLAAKLGKIASPPSNSTSNVHKSSKDQSKNNSDDIFGQQVSADEDDALFSGGTGLFSGPPKLFDDLEDTNNSLWGPGPESAANNIVTQSKKSEPSSTLVIKRQVIDDLFSQNMSDGEDDLFSTKATASVKDKVATNQQEVVKSTTDKVFQRAHSDKNQSKSAFSKDTLFNQTKEVSGAVGLMREDSEETERISHASHAVQEGNLPSQERKPAGGVPMFGKTDVLAGLKAKLPRRQSSSTSESSDHDPDNTSTSLAASQSSNPSFNAKPIGGKGLDADNSFQHIQNVKMGSPSTLSSPDLTSTGITNNSSSQTKNVPQGISSIPYNRDGESDLFTSQSVKPFSGGLFADVNDEEDDLFGSTPAFRSDHTKPAPIVSQKISDESMQSTFPSVSGTTSNEDGKFAKSASSKLLSSSSSTVKANYGAEPRKTDLFSTVPPPLKSEIKAKKPVSLFDDSDSGEDEFLFSSASSAGSRRSQASSDLLTSSSVSVIEKKPLSKKGLFDDDDALFGETQNDPGIDIFSGSSKSTINPSKQTSSSRPVEKDTGTKEDSSNKTLSSSDANSQNSIPNVSNESPLPGTTNSTLKDNLFAENYDEEEENDLFSHKPTSSLLKTKPTLIPSQNDFDDLFSDISVTSSKPMDVRKIQQSSTLVISTQEVQDSQKEHLEASNSAPDVINTHAAEEGNSVQNTQAISGPTAQDGLKPKFDHQEKPKKPEPPRTLNIRNVTDPGVGFLAPSDDEDDDNDLFNTSTAKVKSSSPSPLFKPATKPSVAAKPAAHHQKLTNNDKPLPADTASPVKGKGESCEVDGASPSVSKLRDSLLGGGGGIKIDPLALLPGRRPPPRKNLSEKETPTPTEASESKKSSMMFSNDLTVGFDQPMLSNSTLPSANKDRAKLGVKRRPPSNKARREAARASQILDQSDQESPSWSSGVSSPAADLQNIDDSNAVSTNSVLSPLTDEDDLFGVPQDLPPEYGNQSLAPSDIFSGAPILSPVDKDGQLFKTTQDKYSQDIQQKERSGQSLLKNAPINLPAVPDGLSSEPRLIKGLSDPSSRLPAHNHHVSPEVTSSKLPPMHSQERSRVNQLTQETEGAYDSQNNYGGSADIPPLPSLSNFSTKDTSELLFSSEYDIPKSMETASDSTQQVTNDQERENKSKLTFKNENSTIDPLNNAAELSRKKADSLFQTTDSSEDSDDHSSLFPFVKKKPEAKQVSNHSLFSQTPSLPSKADKSVSKTILGALDGDEDNDLFPSSGKLVHERKTEDSANSIKSKDIKKWQFSDDEDDDDLFLSGAKKPPTSKPTVVKPVSSATPSTVSATNKAPSQSHQSAASHVKKTKPLPSVPKNGLFNEENDDDDELFSKPSQLLKNKQKHVLSAKSSLFDDGDDDLFGPSVSSTRKIPIQPNRPKEMSPQISTQGSSSSRLKKENAFEDPLMALQNDD